MSEASEGKTEGTAEAQGAEDVSAQIAEYKTRVEKMDAKISELLDEKKTEAAKRKEAEEAARKAAEESARKAGDIEAVEKSLRDKFSKELETVTAAKSAAESQLSELLVKNRALQIAGRNAVDADSADILAEWIEHRLGVEIVDGRYQTIVKGADGKRSGLNVEEFEKSLVGEKSLARLLKASEASGGGANGANGRGGAAKPKTITRQQYDAMDPEERQRLIVQDGVRVQ